MTIAIFPVVYKGADWLKIKSVEKEKCLHETKKIFVQNKNIFYIRSGETKNLKKLFETKASFLFI